MSKPKPQSISIAASLIALGVMFFIYPMTLAPSGPNSNGGLAGLIVISLAIVLSVVGFALGKHRPWLKWSLQLLILAITIFALANELGAHWSTGWRYL